MKKFQLINAGIALRGVIRFGSHPTYADMAFVCPVWIHSRAIELGVEAARVWFLVLGSPYPRRPSIPAGFGG